MMVAFLLHAKNGRYQFKGNLSRPIGFLLFPVRQKIIALWKLWRTPGIVFTIRYRSKMFPICCMMTLYN